MGWLPSTTNQLDQSEPQKSADTMDSWYLYHPLLNLARLAKCGHKFALRLFFDSMDYAIRVARCFTTCILLKCSVGNCSMRKQLDNNA